MGVLESMESHQVHTETTDRWLTDQQINTMTSVILLIVQFLVQTRTFSKTDRSVSL